MKAILTNSITGQEIPVTSTAEHPTSSHGIPVWVDADNNAYLQVGLESMQPLYSIKDIDNMEEYKKYLPVIL